MANVIHISFYNHPNNGIIGYMDNRFHKFTFTQSLLYLFGEVPTEDSNKHSWPEYLDQKVEVDGSMVYAWTNSNQAYFPQIDSMPNESNINRNESMRIKPCHPIIIIPPSTVGASDGVVKIRATGGHGHLFNYELQLAAGGSLTNTTGIFTNVPKGFHTIIITETQVGTNPIGADYYGANEIEVPEGVGYGTRYHCIFQNEHGRDVTVQILREGYVGQSEEICLGGTPLTLTTDVIGDDFIGGLSPIEMALDVLQTYDGQFDEMFVDGISWKLRVNDTGYLDMTGSLFADQSSIDHQDNPIHIQMTAYAGLTDLGKIKVADWCGNISLIDVIIAIQSGYNTIQYEIEEFIGMYETDDSSAYSPSMLSHYIVNAGMFNGMTPKDIVSGLLDSFGCTMVVTEENRLRINLIANSILYGQVGLEGSRYSNAGIYTSGITVDIPFIDIKSNRTADAFYIDSAQRYGYINAVNKLSIINEVTELDGWEMPLDDSWSLIDINGDGSLSHFGNDDFMTLTSVYVDYLLTQAYRAAVSVGSFRLYGKNINIESSIEILEVDPNGPYVKSDIHGDIASVLFTADDKASMSRGSYFDRNIGEVLNIWFSQTNEWKSVDLSNRNGAYETPAGGYNMRMWVYGIARKDYNTDEDQTVWPNQIQFKGGSIKAVLPENHDYLNTPFEINTGIDGDDIGEISTLIGDAIQDDYYSLNFGGILARDTMENTKLWETILSGSQLPLREHLANNIMRLRGQSIKRLDGVVNAEYPKVGSLIYDATVDGGYFIPQKFTYNLKFNKLEFSGLEVNRVSDLRILEYDAEPHDRLLEDVKKRLLQ